MRILVAPDKFKGSLSAREVADCIAAGLRDVLPAAIIEIVPVADGGEGTAGVIRDACGGEWVACEAYDALGRAITARYVWLHDRRRAVLDMSEAAGLGRIVPHERDPLRVNSYGVGEMLRDAAQRSAREIIVGLGGSATNDGGFGMARALGFRFFSDERELTNGPAELVNLTRIVRDRRAPLHLPQIIGVADVKNPLLGARGATRTFGPQKDATRDQLEVLEGALARLADVVARDLGCDFREADGAGAAGGLGFGLMSFCGAAIRPGFDLVAEMLDLGAAMQRADVVITGEGGLDEQTLEGKAPAGVARLARKLEKRVFAIVGRATENPAVLGRFDGVFPLAMSSITVEEAMLRTQELLRDRGRDLGRALLPSCSCSRPNPLDQDQEQEPGRSEPVSHFLAGHGIMRKMEEDPPHTVTPFVFSDPAGKRWPRLRLALLIGGILVFLGTVLFVQTLFVAPQLSLPFSLRQLKGQLKSLQKANPAGQPPVNLALWEKFAAARLAAKKPPGPAQPPPAHPRKKSQSNEVRLAFYTNGDPYSFSSLEQRAPQITHLCPEWMAMTNGSGDLQIDADVRLPKLAASKGIALMPLLTNLVGDTWQPEAVENLAHSSPETQDRFIQKVLAILNDAKAAGVVIDWEQVDPAYKKDITTFLDRFTDALHYDDKQLWLCVQPGQDLDYIDFEELSDNIDRFVALLFDETSDIDAPGPLASRRWFEGWLSVLMDGAEAKQWIIALGSYGYDWTGGAKKAELISFPEAMSRASYAEVAGVTVAAPDYNPNFYYEDADKDHSVWFLDVVTFLNQLRQVRDAKAGGFAIYRLGTEDVSIWDALGVARDFKMDAASRSLLEVLKGTDTIADVGEGEVVSVDESQSDGLRALAVDENGYLIAAYSKFPQFPTLYHQGAGAAHQVALTFDDGPDPEWTPQVLDILKAARVKAAFFLVGANAEKYPGLVRRIVAEGHEIGNHTYYHPNLALCWPEHIRLELNATQLLLETITGRSTTLFRPPYAADTSPSKINELIPLQIAQDLGYLVVLENIDPQDWAEPGADIILQRIKQQRRDGSIILLHDAGGDREQTVEALPRILDYLHTRGDSIVSLSTLLGATRDALMPPVQTKGRSLNHFVSGAGFTIFHAAEEFLWAFMIVATALVVLRTLTVIWLAARFRRRWPGGFAEPISVIVAAYNEGKVIAETLRAVLATDYAGEVEVIVVDDGSQDQTVAEVEAVAAIDRRVRLLRQENRGKARALQRGLAAIRSGIVVFLDADTHCQRDTLRYLVQPFADERVGAVSGHAKVGNLRSFIAKCQALEYTCGFNLDRRAYTRWNCLTVVPGAISAIRKSAIDDAGGLSLETLAEDTDLTLALHKRSQRIVYVPEAIAWTEAPETVRTLARQRFRWAYGTLQCLWKHRDMIFNWKYRALGWFSLPSVWFFQIILVAITPLVDLFLLASLPFGAWRAVLPFVIAFLSMDVVLATLACVLERESVLRAWRILPMRLIYRPLLSYVIWKAILRAVKGAFVSWGKLERTASVPVRV